MAKVNADAARAEKLVQALHALRDQGADYPPTVGRLRERADPEATETDVFKALNKKPWAGRVILAAKKDAASPIALAEDIDRLVASPMLLAFALQRACVKKPVQSVAKVVMEVDKSLREPFRAALERRLAEGDLPPVAGSRTVKNKIELFLADHPPPRPPEQELADKLVRVLASQKALGEESYPVPLGRLKELTDPSIKPALWTKALKEEPYKSQVVPVTTDKTSPLVGLKEDGEDLASCPHVLKIVLRQARSADTQAVPLPDLTKKLTKPMQKPFAEATTEKAAADQLPEGVGCLRIKKKPHLFLLADLHLPPRPALRPASPPADDFPRRFDEAFQRLDRQGGGHNFVSLVDLRRELPGERTVFDGGLHQLRQAGRYTLSAAEGRHGILPEEQEAGIREGGTLLLFVSRKTT